MSKVIVNREKIKEYLDWYSSLSTSFEVGRKRPDKGNRIPGKQLSGGVLEVHLTVRRIGRHI